MTLLSFRNVVRESRVTVAWVEISPHYGRWNDSVLKLLSRRKEVIKKGRLLVSGTPASCFASQQGLRNLLRSEQFSLGFRLLPRSR